MSDSFINLLIKILGHISSTKKKYAMSMTSTEFIILDYLRFNGSLNTYKCANVLDHSYVTSDLDI